MIITSEVLKEKEAYESFLNYFQSLKKQEWDIVELFDRCLSDNEEGYADFLFKCVDKNNFERLVDRAIQKGWSLYYAFKYCNQLFTKELFFKAVEYCIENDWYLYCSVGMWN